MLVFTTQENSAFRERWLVSSEVNSEYNSLPLWWIFVNYCVLSALTKNKKFKKNLTCFFKLTSGSFYSFSVSMGPCTNPKNFLRFLSDKMFWILHYAEITGEPKTSPRLFHVKHLIKDLNWYLNKFKFLWKKIESRTNNIFLYWNCPI